MIGRIARRLLGPFEFRAAELYRAAFVDLDAIGSILHPSVAASHILEVGCGEGQLTRRLAHWYPNSTIVGIDVIDGVGRLFKDRPARVSFTTQRLTTFLSEDTTRYDLVILCDVLHHVPPDDREPLLREVSEALSPGGRLVIKDWVKSSAPIHWIAHLSDCIVTGDRVSYLDGLELQDLLASTLKHIHVERMVCIPPWANNLMLLARAPNCE